MLEYGSIWTLVGSDGTTVLFNDGASGLTIEETSGFDSPTVRTNYEALPETDGGVYGDFWYGPRSFTLRGKVGANLSATARNAAVVSLQRAFRGLRTSFTLKTTATGLPAMQCTGRIESIRVTGGFLKEFLVSGVCADPRLYSQALQTGTGTGSPTTPGASFSWVFPINWGGGTGATVQITVTNAGNFTAPPVMRVAGPIASPQVKNATSGDSLYIDGLTLLAAEWLDIDMSAKTVVHSNGTSYYDRVRFPGSVWWQLDPGSSTLELWGSGGAAGTELTATWRDSWA